jgi:RNA polymerase sigma-70 factor (ECF subfamily)
MTADVSAAGGAAEERPTLALLQRWHGGDTAAFELLVARHLPWLRSYVQRRIGAVLRARGQTEDYVQEAVIDALKCAPRFRIAEEDQFRALLGRIVENVLKDENDRHRALRRSLEREAPLPSDTVLDLDAPRRQVTRPSSAAERSERQAWLRLALECLDADDRKLILLREWESLSFAELGKELDTTADGARMRFNRAVLRLAEKLAQLRGGRVREAVARES